MQFPSIKKPAPWAFGVGVLALGGLLAAGIPVHPATGASPSPELGAWGVDLTAADTAVKPGDDFFRYANGSWLENYEIPDDLPGYGSFITLYLRSEDQVKEIIEESAAENTADGSLAQKVGSLYASFLDTETIETKGLQPLTPYFREIDLAETHTQIADLLARFDRIGGGGTPFPFYIDQDEKDPTRYLPKLMQGGIGLPDRDYYLDEENPRFATAREAYHEYLVKMFTLGGEKDPEMRAERVYDLEHKLAEAHWPKEDMRDVDKTYNKMTRDELQALAPDFPWREYLSALGMESQNEFIVNPPSAYTAMSKVFEETPVDVWKDYLTYRLLRGNAGYLPKEIDDTQFEFFSKAITGAKEQRERTKRAVQYVNGTVGQAVGQIYVKKHFSPDAKAQVDELVHNLLVAMGQRIDGLEWMSPETKAAAHEKLSKFTVKIGYPEEWRDYSDLEVTEGDLIGNVFRARAFEHDYQVAKLDKPVNRLEWFMSAQTVNAYYNPGMNEIVFPAGILQAPFFDPNADAAVNYGGIGAVIGHEIGHGFDDQGRKSDGDGVLREWWTEEDGARFKERADKLIEQYNGFTPLEGMNINGQLTLGENIGDLGGLEIAYTAYKLSLKGKEAPVIDGLTGDQRFFLGFAQIWKGKMRDEILTNQLASDPHSPVEFRVNGALPNVDAWYAAFNVKPGDKLYMPPEERVHIW